MKKSKSLKELEKQRKIEIEKCKNDIVYFIETYITPAIILSDFDKEILKAHQEGKQIKLLQGRRTKHYLIYPLVIHEEFKKTHS